MKIIRERDHLILQTEPWYGVPFVLYAFAVWLALRYGPTVVMLKASLLVALTVGLFLAVIANCALTIEVHGNVHQIVRRRGGTFGTSFNGEVRILSFSEVPAIEVKRVTHYRSPDSYLVRCRLTDGTTQNLNELSSSLVETLRLAGEISERVERGATPTIVE